MASIWTTVKGLYGPSNPNANMLMVGCGIAAAVSCSAIAMMDCNGTFAELWTSPKWNVVAGAGQAAGLGAALTALTNQPKVGIGGIAGYGLYHYLFVAGKWHRGTWAIRRFWTETDADPEVQAWIDETHHAIAHHEHQDGDPEFYGYAHNQGWEWAALYAKYVRDSMHNPCHPPTQYSKEIWKNLKTAQKVGVWKGDEANDLDIVENGVDVAKDRYNGVHWYKVDVHLFRSWLKTAKMKKGDPRGISRFVEPRFESDKLSEKELEMFEQFMWHFVWKGASYHNGWKVEGSARAPWASRTRYPTLVEWIAGSNKMPPPHDFAQEGEDRWTESAGQRQTWMKKAIDMHVYDGKLPLIDGPWPKGKDNLLGLVFLYHDYLEDNKHIDHRPTYTKIDKSSGYPRGNTQFARTGINGFWGDMYMVLLRSGMDMAKAPLVDEEDHEANFREYFRLIEEERLRHWLTTKFQLMDGDDMRVHELFEEGMVNVDAVATDLVELVRCCIWGWPDNETFFKNAPW